MEATCSNAIKEAGLCRKNRPSFDWKEQNLLWSDIQQNFEPEEFAVFGQYFIYERVAKRGVKLAKAVLFECSPPCANILALYYYFGKPVPRVSQNIIFSTEA